MKLVRPYINLEKPPLFGNAKEYEFNYHAGSQAEAAITDDFGGQDDE